ncbi:MAG TPA: dihydroorotase [Elusimicrobiota bacterium]|nr:dihydroorotase [Elusimicrobiota bacterium]
MTWPKGEGARPGAASGSLLIRGGLVIDPSQNLEARRDVLIEGGKIRALVKPSAEKTRVTPAVRKPGSSRLDSGLRRNDEIDASGCWVVPGLIVMHVHAREPGGEAAETLATAAQAAAAGGFTTILAMPNTEPALDNPALLELLKAKAEKDACVNVLFAAAATLGRQGQRLSDIARLAAAGAKALTDDGRAVQDAALARRAMEWAADCGLVFIEHCEDESLSRGGLAHEGPAALKKGLGMTPWAAETSIVLRDIALAELTGCRLHLAHVSARQSVQALAWAKERGLLVSGEVTPHHLALCEDDVPGQDANFKINPPLRGKEDRDALAAALQDGTLDAVATDHAPHAEQAKAAGWDAAPPGVIGLETAAGVILTRLVHRGKLSKKRFVESLSASPAKLLGLKSKGSLKPGMDADAAVIAPAKLWTVPSTFVSKSRNSPFAGARLKGQVRFTLVGGRVVHAL